MASLRSRRQHVSLVSIIAVFGVFFVGDIVDVASYSLPILYVLPTFVAALILPSLAVRVVAIMSLVGNVVDSIFDVVPWEWLIVTTGIVAATSILAFLLSQEREATRIHETDATKARQLVQHLVGMAVHDLRTPLTVVYGDAQILGRHLASAAVPERDRAAVQRMLGACQLIKRLVDDLLEASNVASSPFVVKRTPMDLVEVITDVIAHVQATTSAHVLTLDAPDHVDGVWDRGRTRQVITNLVSDAIRYSSGGDVRTTVRTTGDAVIIRVSDQGTTLTATQLRELSQPFGHLDHTRPGMGLRLFIARRIVEAHQGRLWVESTDGGGTTFCVSLPTGQMPTSRD